MTEKTTPVTTTNPHMKPGESEAAFVRRMGWGVGTRLIADEGYGPSTIEITAIGRDKVLCSWNGGREASTTFSFRDWQVIDE